MKLFFDLAQNMNKLYAIVDCLDGKLDPRTMTCEIQSVYYWNRCIFRMNGIKIIKQIIFYP